jgi:4-hydroxybenzoate polyprenyltransferase
LWKALLISVRPKQWPKNALVFAAPLFAFRVDLPTATVAGGAFLAFCLASAGVYLMNDLFDLEKDRRHPIKKSRPLASGALSPSMGVAAAVVLLSGSLALGYLVRGAFAVVILEYLFLQVAYNLVLKEIVILDVFGLAAGFVLRAAGGGLAVDVPLSPWFLFCVGVSALYIGFHKRRGELARLLKGTKGTRGVLLSYATARTYLAQVEAVLMGCVLLSYALWTVQGADNPLMMATMPFVFYGVLRYQYKATTDPTATEAPEELWLRDIPLLIAILGWLISCFVVLSLGSKS